MAAILSNVYTGNWADAAAWPGGTIPGSGDTVTLANGSHITIPAGTTVVVGDSANPETTPAIKTNGGTGTGLLTVSGTLQILGNLQQGNSQWSVLGAGIVESMNTTTSLQWRLTGASSQTNNKLVVTGTSRTVRATIRRGAGSAGFQLLCVTAGGSFSGCGQIFTNATFQGLGTAGGYNTSSTFGIEIRNFYVDHHVTWNNVIVDGCGVVTTNNYTTGQLVNWTWDNVLIKNTLSTDHAAVITFDSVTNPTGTRRLQDVHITKGSLRMLSAYLMDVTRCVFADGYEVASATWQSFTDCLTSDYLLSGDKSPSPAGDITRGIHARRNMALGGNWHGLTYNGSTPRLVDGVIFDGVIDVALAEGGDLLMIGTGAVTLTARNILATKSARADGYFGNIISMLGSVNTTVAVMENCTGYTRYGATGGLLGVGETYMGRANMVQNFRNNLAMGIAAGAGVLIVRDNTGDGNNIRDSATPANILNNAAYQQHVDAVNGNAYRPGTSGTGDHIMWTVNPAPSLDANPTFFDDTRNLATWYRSVVGGTAGTREADTQAAFAAIASMNDLSPVAGATIIAAYDWIRAGYRPTNTALKTDVSANNGGWIGAVEGIASPIAAISSGYHQRMMR